MITPSDERRCGFLHPHRWHDTCCCPPSSVLGVLVLEKKVWIGKGLKAKYMVKGWGHLWFYLWGWQRDRGPGSWCISREILERREASLTESPSGRLEF
jgi:hypothetical protein